MGEVYRARDSKLARDVAIKVLPADLSRDAAALTRFEREAKAVAALSHPNILAIHDFGTHGDTTYAVMELLEGESLQQRLTEGPLPQRKTLEVARDVALGLAAAHEKGIVHRDLKPANLFLTRDGRVKILDFGLARQIALPSADDTNSPTVGQASEPGFIVGTVGYIAPEQLKGQPADARSDIFSFGAVLYEMLSGKRAFREDSAIATMNAILKEDPPSLSESGRQMPLALERIVGHCLEKNPAERFQSARDLAFDLDAASGLSGVSTMSSPAIASSRRRMAMLLGASVAAVVLAFFAGGRVLASKHSMEATFRRLTFRRGSIDGARFTPDGQNVVYTAAWEGAEPEIFTVRTDGAESRPLGIKNANVLAVSKKGELAISLKKAGTFWTSAAGTLARVPLGGGVPREVLEGVTFASWGPDGEELAVTRLGRAGAESWIEYPIGHVLDRSSSRRYESLAVSSDGKLVAVKEINEGGAAIAVFDRSGKKRYVSSGWFDVQALAWSPGGAELLFIARRNPADESLRAVDRSGRERVILPGASDLSLSDVSMNGQLLLWRGTFHRGIVHGTEGSGDVNQLGWLDGSTLSSLSDDGQRILFTEEGEGASPKRDVYMRKADGSPAVRLGDGVPYGFSPDGKWAVAITRETPQQLILLPTGPGSPRKIPLEGIKNFGASFLADGRLYVLEFDVPPRLSVVSNEGGKTRVLNATDITTEHGGVDSPDGASIAIAASDHRVEIVSTTGGPPRFVPGAILRSDDTLIQWSADGRFLYLARTAEFPARVFLLNIQTGERVLWKELKPADSLGATRIFDVCVSRDGRSYAYDYYGTDSNNLYVVSGLK